jgi:AcrR family transcriptional regulator
MARPVVFPAPGRGSYDRSLTRAERDAEHRERLLRATAEVMSDGPLTVARIVQRAGVGRSTFYEFFDSPEHLLEQLEQRLLRSLEAALAAGIAEARTPLERLRAIARSWLTTLEERGVEARVVMARPGRALLSAPGELLYQTLQRVVEVARSEVGWFKTTDDVSVLAAAAAGEAISRRHLTVAPLREAPRLLAEVMIKLLR